MKPAWELGPTVTGRGPHLASVLFLIAATCAPARAGDAPPNVVLILADDLGWVDVSVGATNFDQPSDFYETHNLERLARRGLSFSSVYAQANCTPSRAALLSGQYPPRTRVYNVRHLNRGEGSLLGPEQNEDLTTETVTLAETMKAAGYVTAHVGKYHVGGHEGGDATMPPQQGIDFNFGGGPDGAPGSYFARQSGGVWRFGDRVGPELDAYAEPYTAEFVAARGLPASLVGTPKHLTDAVTEASVDFMRAQVSAGQPFYLQLHLFAIHSPNQGRPDLVSKYQAKKITNPSQRGHDNVQVAALIEAMDQGIGRVLDFLADPDGDGDPGDSVERDTLVVFLSDNGGDTRTSNAPLRGSKGMLTDGGIRVPMIASMPGTIPLGETNDTLIHFVDVYPTFAEFASAPLPSPAAQPLDGLSLGRIFRGEAASLARSAIYYHFPGYLDTRATPTSSIIKEIDGIRYKLLFFYENRNVTLYNLTDDIGERSEMFATGGEETRALATDMLTDLRGWLEETGAIYPLQKVSEEPVPPPDPSELPPPGWSATTSSRS